MAVDIMAHHRTKVETALAGREPPALPVDPEAVPPSTQARPRGKSCKKLDPWWKHMAENGYSMAQVLASPLLAEHVAAAHMALCRVCPHSDPGEQRGPWGRSLDVVVFIIGHSVVSVLGSVANGGLPPFFRPSPGALFCRCCPCPNWAAADLNAKTAHSGWNCPHDPPAW